MFEQELFLIPKGATYLNERRRLVGDEHNMSLVQAADHFLETARCVGGLTCCRDCLTPGVEQCAQALKVRQLIVTTILRQQPQDGPSERNALIAAMDVYTQSATESQ